MDLNAQGVGVPLLLPFSDLLRARIEMLAGALEKSIKEFWYEGKYTRFPYTLFGSMKPKFEGIVIVVEFDSCVPRLEVEANDLDRYRMQRRL